MPTTFTHLVFVDFENVPDVDLGVVDGKPVHVTLLIGKKQVKMQTSLVTQIHRLAEQVELVEVGASGHNALDLTLAFYLGQAVERNTGAQFSIVSKDKDFEPMLGHLREQKVAASRHDSFAAVFAAPAKKPAAAKTPPAKKPARDRFAELVEKMRTVANHRPKKREALAHHITAFYGKDLPVTGAEGVVSQLEARGVIAIDDKGKVSYR